MSDRLKGNWESNFIRASGITYLCGYCGMLVGPSLGYRCRVNGNSSSPSTSAYIYLCPNCNKPTFKTLELNEQIPAPLVGTKLIHLPKDIEQLYNEARNCITVEAYTSATLSFRKLLMNVSVSKGAVKGKNFIEYVNFLEDNHFIPPNSKDWVDHIRLKGNEATHDLPNVNKADAIELLQFTEFLLRLVYEMPMEMQKYKK